MKALAFVSAVILCVNLIGATDFRPDYEYREDIDGWIKFHLVPGTWRDAMRRCTLEGAVLASPITDELLRTMKEVAGHVHPSRSLFTGFHDTFFRGEYKSIEGVPIDDINPNWAENEPNNFNNAEDCLMMSPDGQLYDVKCGDVYSYMCYKKRTDDMPPMNVECGTTDPGYHKNYETGSCYKYHHIARHWSLAHEICSVEGGHLAIVNSIAETNVLKNLFFSGPKNTATSIHKKMVLLGFRYSDNIGRWMTVNGENLDQTGYSIWENGEPNNFTDKNQNYEGEDCGAIDMGKNRLGLNDLWCGYNQPFICEKDANTLPTTTTTTTTTSTTTPAPYIETNEVTSPKNEEQFWRYFLKNATEDNQIVVVIPDRYLPVNVVAESTTPTERHYYGFDETVAGTTPSEADDYSDKVIEFIESTTDEYYPHHHHLLGTTESEFLRSYTETSPEKEMYVQEASDVYEYSKVPPPSPVFTTEAESIADEFLPPSPPPEDVKTE